MKIIECPRDAMQGIKEFIPSEIKANYINRLLKVGFDTIDFGSFVSPKATPQMKDTAEVLKLLSLEDTKSKLLTIVANMRGVNQAVSFEEIDYLGFPLSISETFQQRNTRKSIAEAFTVIEEAQNICLKHNKTLVVYLSMAFGNPYGEAYQADILEEFINKLDRIEIKIISLSDTIGVSDRENIHTIFSKLVPMFSHIEIGAHFHSNPNTAVEKVAAAYQAGCRRFDGAIKGFGGCPMAKDDLTGNIATEKMLAYFAEQDVLSGLDMKQFSEALNYSSQVFENVLH